MKLTIDQTILDKNDLTLEEFLVLYLNAKDVDIGTISQSLVAKGIANKDLFSSGKLVVSDKAKELISTIFTDSEKNVINKDSEFTQLATELREIYPAGRKDGTAYMWRGTTAEVAKKLKTLVVKYGFTINKGDVVKATKEYVNSFNGNYRYMQLLKYFILKSVKDADGNVDVKSELMSIIENSGQLDSQRDDWVSNMI
jgi:hypothetical protein